MLATTAGLWRTWRSRLRRRWGHAQLTTLADCCHYSGRQVLAREQAGIVPYVPKPQTSGAKAEGRFGKQDFVHLAENDEHRCPAGERLPWRSNNVEDRLAPPHYWTNACISCSIKPQCTTGEERLRLADAERYPVWDGWVLCHV
jgi:hypothetical protein